MTREDFDQLAEAFKAINESLNNLRRNDLVMDGLFKALAGQLWQSGLIDYGNLADAIERATDGLDVRGIEKLKEHAQVFRDAADKETPISDFEPWQRPH